MLLVFMTVLSASGQYGSRGDKRYRDRYSRTDTYGDVVEIRLSEPGTLAEKMPVKLCDRSRCVDSRDKQVDNYIDLELERVRIMSSGSSSLLGGSGERDVLGSGLEYSSHLRSIVLPKVSQEAKRFPFASISVTKR